MATSTVRSTPNIPWFLNIKFLGAVVIFFIMLIFSGNLFEVVEPDEIVCIQGVVSGKLTWYTSSGPKWQGLGKVTTYKKRSIYQFAIAVRFNDGGHGKMCGSIQYDMPLDVTALTSIHTKFGSQDAVQNQLIQTVVNKSIYMTGPLMSSKESYAEKRNYLLSYVEDQIAHGVYKTIQKDVKTVDPMTGVEKTITEVKIVMDTTKNIPLRQEESTLSAFNIRTFNFAIDSLPYDDAVEKQIKDQQQLIMNVQTAVAEAKKAEQQAITVAKQGEANAAKAKWEQEVEKAKAVTLAQQQLEVATLEAKSAEQNKRKLILEGEGEAQKKRLIMQADGALDKKLDAYKYGIDRMATAIENYKGAWVPSVVMGEGNSRSGSGATDFMNLLTMKTAKDLGLDMSMQGSNNTK